VNVGDNFLFEGGVIFEPCIFFRSESKSVMKKRVLENVESSRVDRWKN
jgi:hypothetical protein